MTTLWEFGGGTFEPERDGERLRAQLRRVRLIMSDHQWHTLHEISLATGDPEASVSARIRDLRKRQHGGHVIERRFVHRGLWIYRWAP